MKFMVRLVDKITPAAITKIRWMLRKFVIWDASSAVDFSCHEIEDIWVFFVKDRNLFHRVETIGNFYEWRSHE